MIPVVFAFKVSWLFRVVASTVVWIGILGWLNKPSHVSEDDIPLVSICNGLDQGSWLWYLYGCFLPIVKSKLDKKHSGVLD